MKKVLQVAVILGSILVLPNVFVADTQDTIQDIFEQYPKDINGPSFSEPYGIKAGFLSDAMAFDNVTQTIGDAIEVVLDVTVPDVISFFKIDALCLVIGDTKPYTGAVALELSHHLFENLSLEDTKIKLGSLVAGAQARKGLVFAINLEGASDNAAKHIQEAARRFGVPTSGIPANFAGIVLQMTSAEAASQEMLRPNGILVVTQSFEDTDQGFAATAAFIRYNADFVTSAVSKAYDPNTNSIRRDDVTALSITPDMVSFISRHAVDRDLATAPNLADANMGRAKPDIYQAIKYVWPVIGASIHVVMSSVRSLVGATVAFA